ncbi:sugar ABC transporter ATP-binding protein (plasmid) [Lichenicola cladoniae]|uniref:Sugar ABC transporter ATP-binding protein n=1 Tax=Lichenicola cladoniae TaxID=1484109 RepID=A0A6M8HZY9_9PROT|nr:sugar ABC transporter ATP-binding protein [Lichenicola cladoniae]QKE93641.1 sugar ABC transporter ATP-binding protein [Lichenicola cladoniae]
MLLETRGLTKSFGAVRALRDVSFSLRTGEIHGLMGENGAGKSTLIKLLTGLNRPDSGSILLDDQPVTFDSPRAAQLAGVAAVYQEINLIPERSVADNLFLGREPRRFGVLVDRARMIDEARALLLRYHLDIDPRRTLRTLGLGLQQLVSIARVVSLGARAIILDEPTSALSAAEVDLLYSVVEQLRRDGIGLIYVSHRLSECYRLCDRLTVLRDGAVVASAATADLPRGQLVAAMLGREQSAGPGRTGGSEAGRKAGQAEAPALDVGALSWRNRVRDVSLTVGRGEIVGLAGLLGSGRTETFKAIYGAEKPDAGSVAVDGRRVARSRPSESIRRGLAFLSEDRRSEGVFAQLSVAENLTAAVLPRISRWGIISRRRRDALVARYVRELGIKTDGFDVPITSLSGGNQQKVLIARALCTDPRMVMLDDPTRGIDVGAKAEVHRVVRGLAAEGLGVLMTSSELEEVVELSDRLVVLDEGRVTGELETAGRDSDDVLALLAGGAAPAETPASGHAS